MLYQKNKDKLARIDQLHLIQHWNTLSVEEQCTLSDEIEKIDVALFSLQRDVLRATKKLLKESLDPFHDFVPHETLPSKLGTTSLQKGPLVGCLLIAGGQGSRLSWSRPKGTFPVSIIQNKSLFQIFAEKMRAASILVGHNIPLAIMTSKENDAETRVFFQDHHYFQLDPDSVDFFMQDTIPLLNENNNMFLETCCTVAKGPAGNGLALQLFYHARLWHKWREQGVQCIEFFPIDNARAMPYDRVFIDHHMQCAADVTIKCIARKEVAEQVGVLIKQQEKIHVVEYSELSENEQNALNDKGDLKHICANISVFCFSMSFVEKAAMHYNKQIPWHVAKKKAKYWQNQISESSQTPIFWKFEKFIFDLLPFAEKVKALLYPREKIFAPLKNAQGVDSLPSVQAALQEADREAFFAVSGIYPATQRLFELDPQFYYPTAELLAQWKNKPLPPTPYVSAKEE